MHLCEGGPDSVKGGGRLDCVRGGWPEPVLALAGVAQEVALGCCGGLFPDRGMVVCCQVETVTILGRPRGFAP
jgi:hypothetical protein